MQSILALHFVRLLVAVCTFYCTGVEREVSWGFVEGAPKLLRAPPAPSLAALATSVTSSLTTIITTVLVIIIKMIIVSYSPARAFSGKSLWAETNFSSPVFWRLLLFCCVWPNFLFHASLTPRSYLSLAKITNCWNILNLSTLATSFSVTFSF